MSAPGVGVQDLIAVIVKCKDIYTAFADEYESAPARVQELVDTCRYLTNVFADITAIGDGGGGGGVPEELHRTFVRKLEECNAFIKTYHALKSEYLHQHRSASITDRLLDHWRTTWQTGRYAFDGRRAKELRDALDLETGKLLLFVMTSMRNRTTSLATSTWSGAAHGPPPGYDSTWIENIFARLRLANNRYEREMSASAQFRLTGGREPDLSGVYAEMYGVWDDFCARAGLPAASRPPLPTDWVAAPVRNRHNAVLNATTTSVHLFAQRGALPEPRRIHTLQSEPEYLSTSPTESSFSNPSVSTIRTVPPSNTTTPSVMPCDHVVCSTTCLFHPRGLPPPQPSPFRAIPPAVFYQATVYVALPNEGRLKLKEWRVDRSGPRPKVIWMVEAPPGVLEHVLPRDVFPETLHSSHGKTAHVAFPQPAPPQAHPHPQHKDDDSGHRLVWKPEDRFRGTGSKYEDFLPEYLFVLPTARRVFQSDVRDKELVEGGTFDTDLIWTDRTETRHDKRESWGQDLKVWCGRRVDEGRYSLSFNVTKGSHLNRHVECELRRFALTARPGHRGHTDTVYLDFDSGDRDSHSTAATDEIHSGSTSPTGLGRKMRRLSGMFSKSPKGERSRASRSSFTSQRSVPLVAEDDFFASLRYLAVQFSDVEDPNGRIVEEASDVADRFRHLFDRKRKEESSRSPMLPPNPRFTTWNFDLGESAMASHEHVPQQTSRDVSPTARSLSPGSNRATTPSQLLGLPYPSHD